MPEKLTLGELQNKVAEIVHNNGTGMILCVFSDDEFGERTVGMHTCNSISVTDMVYTIEMIQQEIQKRIQDNLDRDARAALN